MKEHIVSLARTIRLLLIECDDADFVDCVTHAILYADEAALPNVDEEE